MAHLKLKQVLSNLSYNNGSLTVSGSGPSALIVSGAAEITSTPTQTGSLTIQNINTFGDSGSFYTMDLGEY